MLLDTYTVAGSYAGRVDEAADETARIDRFEYGGLSRAEAFAKAQEIAKALRPGGIVWVAQDADCQDVADFNAAEFVLVAEAACE